MATRSGRAATQRMPCARLFERPVERGLSQAALETLAIVAYLGPCSRPGRRAHPRRGRGLGRRQPRRARPRLRGRPRSRAGRRRPLPDDAALRARVRPREPRGASRVSTISPTTPTSCASACSRSPRLAPPSTLFASNLPGAAAKHGHGVAVAVIPSTSSSRAADHEVDVDAALVDPRPLRGVLDGMLVAVAERDVRLRRSRRSACRRRRARAGRSGRRRPRARSRRAVTRRRRCAATARSASAPSSASIFTARPPSNSTRMPEIIEPESSSGIVALTCPSTRSGSGVVNSSSVGRFGECRRPSTVSRSPAAQCAEGRRPIVSSVPGPCSLSAS